MSDVDLKIMVEAAIAARPGLSGAKVGAEVFGGRVFLIGEVATLAQETEALLAAKGVAGVSEVISSLLVDEVRPQKAEIVDDEELRNRIEATLLLHGIAIRDGGVTVAKGDVYLHGRVATPQQSIHAERLARVAGGVRTVHNQLHSERWEKRAKAEGT